MRLFVAAELPPEMLDALAETSGILRGAVRGRFVGPDLFHVTLAFLGEVPAIRVDDAAAAIERACAEVPAFATALGALGIFGRASQAILWQGFASGQAEWDALASQVRSELSAAGFSFDKKGFLPHVTLMRRANVTRGALPMPCVEQGEIRTVTLFASDLSGERPAYTTLASYELIPK